MIDFTDAVEVKVNGEDVDRLVLGGILLWEKSGMSLVYEAHNLTLTGDALDTGVCIADENDKRLPFEIDLVCDVSKYSGDPLHVYSLDAIVSLASVRRGSFNLDFFFARTLTVWDFFGSRVYSNSSYDKAKLLHVNTKYDGHETGHMLLEYVDADYNPLGEPLFDADVPADDHTWTEKAYSSNHGRIVLNGAYIGNSLTPQPYGAPTITYKYVTIKMKNKRRSDTAIIGSAIIDTSVNR